jgi:hypothetical protein
MEREKIKRFQLAGEFLVEQSPSENFPKVVH